MTVELVSSLSPQKKTLTSSIEASSSLIISQQDAASGYWSYTLEANETIGAGYIMLTHAIDLLDKATEAGLVRRMLGEQRSDGSWALFYRGSGDLSTTVECYFALKLAGFDASHPAMQS